MNKLIRVNASSSIFLKRPDLFDAAIHGINDVLTIQGLTSSFITGGEETAHVLTRFEDEAYNTARQQIDLEKHLTNLAQRASIASPTADFILTGRDMYTTGANFVFGCTLPQPDWQVSIQSVARFIWHTTDEKLQWKITAHIARHEYAHMAGLNDTTDYANPDKRGGLYEGHCAERCTMRQVMNVSEAVALTKSLDGHTSAGFCSSCVTSLRRKATQP